MDQDVTWYGGRLGPGDFVLDGDPVLSKRGIKRRTAPQFSAHVYCGQTAWWIKMPLDTEVGLGPGDIVLDGAQLSPPKKGHAPNFWPVCIVAKQSPNLAIAELLLIFVFSVLAKRLAG